MGIRDTGKKPHFSVRSKRYRYTLCSDGKEELYDHQTDPNEWTNLSGNPKLKDVKDQLHEEMMSILYKTTMPKDFPPANDK